jgi:hypothetical protein
MAQIRMHATRPCDTQLQQRSTPLAHLGTPVPSIIRATTSISRISPQTIRSPESAPALYKPPGRQPSTSWSLSSKRLPTSTSMSLVMKAYHVTEQSLDHDGSGQVEWRPCCETGPRPCSHSCGRVDIGMAPDGFIGQPTQNLTKLICREYHMGCRAQLQVATLRGKNCVSSVERHLADVSGNATFQLAAASSTELGSQRTLILFTYGMLQSPSLETRST